MRPKSIGIIGGAGPLAGVFLLERVFTLCRERFNCHKDADYPEVFMINYPFSEMLSLEINADQICDELKRALDQLRKNGAEMLAIACNTLHAFLDEEGKNDDLLHLCEVVAREIPVGETPLVLCTSTSLKFKAHSRFFNCTYPDAQTQADIDRRIDQILKGGDKQKIKEELLTIIESQTANVVVLGCTELSLFTEHLKGSRQRILDPLEIMAEKIVQGSFSGA